MFRKVFTAPAGAAADLLANAERFTQWIPAQGARCVQFHWVATSGGTPQVAANAVEGTNIDPIAAAGQSLTLTPAHLGALLPTTVHVLNNAGGVMHTIVPGASATFLQVKYVRMTIKGAAAATLTALQCVSATVWYDGDSDPGTGVGTVSA